MGRSFTEPLPPPARPEKNRSTYTFTAEQDATLIASLALASQLYANPRTVIETLRVISPRAADGLAEALDERDARRRGDDPR